MNFKLWESSFDDLYQSAVNAFPNTTKRQHATGTVQISNVRWTPFLGMNTLLLRAEADNTADNGGIYRPVIMFKNVKYQDSPGTNVVEIVAHDDGKTYYLNKLSKNNVLVRCQCMDLHWRFQHEDFSDRSLYGADRKPYTPVSNRGPVNPTSAIGVCKHLLKLFSTLQDDEITH